MSSSEDRRLRDSPCAQVRWLEGNELAREALREAYAAASAFVLPTRGEGWGLPCVEAMAMALPVIATNFSGPTAYLTERNGYPLPVEGVDGAGVCVCVCVHARVRAVGSRAPPGLFPGFVLAWQANSGSCPNSTVWCGCGCEWSVRGECACARAQAGQKSWIFGSDVLLGMHGELKIVA